MKTTLISVALIIGSVVPVALALWFLYGVQRRKRRETRLEQAFERARKVRHSGSGVQGTPYSLYGDDS